MTMNRRTFVQTLAATPVALALPAGVACAQSRAKVALIQTFPSIAFAAVYVARAQNHFEQEGIDLDLQIVNGDAIGAQGLVGRTAPMAAIGGAEAVLLAQKGVKDFVSVMSIISAISVSVTVRKDVAEARGITAAMPIDKRLAALKGLTIATGSPGGAIHTTMLYLLGRANLDPKTDVTLLSVAGGPAMLAGLKSKQLDAIAISPPAPETAEVEGAGTLVISLSRGDVPELGNIPYDVLLVYRDYVAANPDTVRRVVRALSRGMNVMREKPAVAKESLLKYFDKTPPDVMDAVVKNLRTAFHGDGRQSVEMWKNLLDFTAQAKKQPIALDPKEGVLWTNEFVGK
jgi:NitT/TauT family transport system substrate-binding protein